MCIKDGVRTGPGYTRLGHCGVSGYVNGSTVPGSPNDLLAA